VTSYVDVYVVRSYSILSSPRRRVVVWLERCCMKLEKNSRKFSKDEKKIRLEGSFVDRSFFVAVIFEVTLSG
jgi:hypothetical protein